jgi:hypothetical protein
MLVINAHATKCLFILSGGSIVNIWLLVVIVDLMMYFEVLMSYEMN